MVGAPGMVYVVGLGPGDRASLTDAAKHALDAADALCGYGPYVDQVRRDYPGKTVYTTPMKGELDRCRWALEQAAHGHTVALLCSGDAGVYGMASPILELAAARAMEHVPIRIVPGLTAALSGGALLGAPLGHDFCVISLSDLLTPWDQIRRRLIAAAQGDFVICLYNPGSGGRPDHLRRACELLGRYKPGDTVCGVARNIGRPGEQVRLCTLKTLSDLPADMTTTVFIGSSRTKRAGDWMVTPRGYPGQDPAGDDADE